MAEKLSLGVQIGAALTSGFNNAIGGAREKFNILGKVIKDLSAQRGLIERVEQDRAALDKARLGLTATQKQVAALKLALRADPSNKGLAADLAAAQAKAEKLSIAIEKQRSKLLSSETAMQKAGLKVGALGHEYAKLGKTLDETRLKHQKMDAVMTKKSAAGERLGELRGQLLGMAGVAYAGSKIVGQAMEFESAMADVRKVVNFKAPDGLVQLGSALKNMSKEIPISAAGLAQIAAAGGQLGVAEKDLLSFTRTVATMATAFDMLPEEAGEAMAKLSNVYQLPITAMSSLGDAINHLSDNTASKAKDIVPILARVGGSAKQFGLTAVQVAALGSAFVSLGKTPEVASTAINAMLTKLQTSTKQNGKFQGGLEEIGLSAEGMEAAIAKDGQAALTDFLERLSKVDAGARAGLLVDLFGLEYSDDISLLAGSMEEYRKALALVGQESSYAGSMTREFNNRAATTANQLQLMKNSVSVVAINLGSTLLPALNAILKPMATMANWAGDLIDRFPLLGKFIGAVAAGIGTFVIGLVAVTAATWLWNAALLAVMANPVGLAIAGIALAAGTIITFWEPISAFFSDVWQGIKAGIAPVVAAFAPFAPLFSAIGSAISGLSPYFDAFTTAVSGAFSMVSQLFTPLAATSDAFKSATTVGQRFGLLVGQEITKLLTPVTLLMKGLAWAGEKMGLVDRSEVAVGATVRSHNAASVRPDLRLINGGQSIPPTPARQFPQVQAANRGGGTTINNNNNVAPTTITVHAAPGMDEKKLAAEVDRRLDARDSAAQAKKRGALHD